MIFMSYNGVTMCCGVDGMGENNEIPMSCGGVTIGCDVVVMGCYVVVMG